MDNYSTVYEDRNNAVILGNKLATKITNITLADFFEISDKAQEGGMGDVYFCRDKRDNKFYVLKKAKKTEYEDIFRKEAELVLKLGKNPYVVYTKTIVSDKNSYYIVMDYIGKQPYNLNDKVEGETLTKVMNKTSIEPKQAVIWAIQLCKGMAFLNESGIESHKDIKPDNILIDPNNNIKITDFGLVSIDKKCGTPRYRSPEYCKKITTQSDIYSFGLVLYQMLNGGNLLSAKTLNSDAKENEFIDGNKIKSNYCQDIIKKCLQKEPGKRHKNFEELEEALTQYLHSNWPEYTIPEIDTEPMTADDYFFKGLGYYVIKNNSYAFYYYSKAISKNRNYAPAYYGRYLLLRYINTPVKVAIPLILVILLSSLLDIIFAIVPCFCNYNIGLFVVSFFVIVPILLLFIIIFQLTKQYHKYYFLYILPLLLGLSQIREIIEWKYNYYLIQKEGIMKFLLQEKISELIYILLFGVVVVLFCRLILWAVKQKTPKLSVSVIYKVFKVLWRLFKEGVFLLKSFFISILFDDKKKACQLDKTYYYWDIVQNQKGYSIETVLNAYDEIEKADKLLPKDFILYQKNKLYYLNNNYDKTLELAEYFEKKYNVNTSSYWIPVMTIKAKVYEIQGKTNWAQKTYDKILSYFKDILINRGLKDDFVTNIYIYPQSGIYSKKQSDHINALYLLLAYYERENLFKENSYIFERATMLFQVGQYAEALILYQKIINDVDLNLLQKDVDKSLQQMSQKFFDKTNYLLELRDNLGLNTNNIWHNIGICYYANKNYKEAFESFSKAIQLNPQNKRLYHYRAICSIPGHKFLYKGILLDSYYSFEYRNSDGNHLVFQS